MPEALLAVPVLGDILGGIGTLGSGLGASLGLGAAATGEAAAASAPLDLLSFGSAVGTATPEALGSIVPATGALASNLATEPAFASSLYGSFAPALDTGVGTLANLGGGAGGPLEREAISII